MELLLLLLYNIIISSICFNLFINSLFIIFNLFFLLIITCYFIRKSFTFPCLFKKIFQQFSFNIRYFVFDFSKIIKLFRIFISINDILINNFLYLFISQLNSNSTIFFKLFFNNSTFKFFILQIFDNIIKLIRIIYIIITHIFCQLLSII